jgi:DUF2889 family protein
MIVPAVLAARDRYERVMDGRCDSTGDDAVTHVVRLDDPVRALEIELEALPSPSYVIRAARLRSLRGDIATGVSAGFASLAGVAMVAGFTRRVAEATGGGAGGTLAVDAAIEAARLSRQVARLPRARAERAERDAWEAWQLDRAGWIDLPGSCFTYSDAGRALFGTRTVVANAHADLYSPRPGQRGVFARRKTARVERRGDRLVLFHAMHDNVHGFELTLEVDAATGRIERAESVTSRLPYLGICSEPQGRITSLVGEIVDPGLSRRIQALLGGSTGCAQLYDLTADLLKILRE